MTKRRIPLLAVTLAYLIMWVPYISLTRYLAIASQGAVGRPLGGLEILPVSLTVSLILTYVFFAASGWWRAAHQLKLGGLSLPRPTRWTLLAGVGAALLMIAVPLSYTFAGVSIPFVQLLMRGDVLLIAPVIDLMTGRKVRWFSWIALALVAIGLIVTIRQRGGLSLPPLCIAVIGLYILGYFIRLGIMSRIAKSGDLEALKQYYVEEQLVAAPIAVAALAGIALFAAGKQAVQLQFGFTGLWHNGVTGLIAVIGGLVFIQGLLATTILLDERENTYCVPLERSASVLGGTFAAYLLASFFHMPFPTSAELFGAGLLILAVVILSLGPMFRRPNKVAT